MFNEINFDAPEFDAILANDLADFDPALTAATTAEELQAICEKHDSLRFYLNSENVSVGAISANAVASELVPTAQLFEQASINLGSQSSSAEPHSKALLTLIALFTKALNCRYVELYTSIWDKNIAFKNYVLGKNGYKTNDVTEGSLIDLPTIIAIFDKMIASRCDVIIKTTWDTHPYLKPYMLGEQVSHANETMQIDLEQSLKFFKRVAQAHSQFLMFLVWDKNPHVKPYMMNSNNRTNLQQSLVLLEAILVSQSSKIIGALCHAKPSLPVINFITGKLVSKNDGSNESMQLNFDESLSWFKKIMSSQNNDIVLKFWDKNPHIKPYLLKRAQPEVGSSNHTTLSQDHLIDIFTRALSGQIPNEIILDLWFHQPYLSQYFCGKTADGEADPDVDIQDLLDRFKLVYASLTNELKKNNMGCHAEAKGLLYWQY